MMKKVVRKKIITWQDAGILYPIANALRSILFNVFLRKEDNNNNK